jgi:hypothetical protein
MDTKLTVATADTFFYLRPLPVIIRLQKFAHRCTCLYSVAQPAIFIKHHVQSGCRVFAPLLLLLCLYTCSVFTEAVPKKTEVAPKQTRSRPKANPAGICMICFNYSATSFSLLEQAFCFYYLNKLLIKVTIAIVVLIMHL